MILNTQIYMWGGFYVMYQNIWLIHHKLKIYRWRKVYYKLLNGKLWSIYSKCWQVKVFRVWSFMVTFGISALYLLLLSHQFLKLVWSKTINGFYWHITMNRTTILKAVKTKWKNEIKLLLVTLFVLLQGMKS